MKELLEMFISFAKVGAVTFGGGYAMLPILQREIVDNKHWATEDELLDYYAIGQCTPGVIAANTATFIGYRKKGIVGGITATLGVVTPSIILIMIIAAFVQNFADLDLVKYAFCGIRVCVSVLIANAVINLWKKAVVDKFTLAVFIVVLGLAAFTDIPVVSLVVLSGIAGAVYKLIKNKHTKGGDNNAA